MEDVVVGQQAEALSTAFCGSAATPSNAKN